MSETHLAQTKGKLFSEKICLVAEWLEQEEISEIEAYQILTAEGEPSECPKPDTEQKPCIEFF